MYPHAHNEHRTLQLQGNTTSPIRRHMPTLTASHAEEECQSISRCNGFNDVETLFTTPYFRYVSPFRVSHPQPSVVLVLQFSVRTRISEEYILYQLSGAYEAKIGSSPRTAISPLGVEADLGGVAPHRAAPPNEFLSKQTDSPLPQFQGTSSRSSQSSYYKSSRPLDQKTPSTCPKAHPVLLLK